MTTAEVFQKLTEIKQEGTSEEEQQEQARALLASLQPLQLLWIVYSREPTSQRPPILLRIASAYPTRRRLLNWVYAGNVLLGTLPYARLPSRAKRLFVRVLVALARRRDPWMSSRLLHTMAFRPTYFDQTDGRRQTRERPGYFWRPDRRIRAPYRRWGSLYTERRVEKAPRRTRLLHVPVPPLRRLQRLILKLTLNRLCEQLPDYVYGCRPANTAAVFRNALQHMGQEYIVSFDIRDFFPSVRLRHIIPMLERSTAPLLHIRQTEKDELGKEHEHIEQHHWTRDAAILVARLATHRGHLPQGAPTSPALATLVFHEYDRRIRDAIGPSLVYTRYVDDITISVSRRTARSLGLQSPESFRAHVESRVVRALAGSGFSLNPRKTRCGSVERGFVITGIRTDGTGLSLPRAVKRQLRVLLHNVRKHGIVKAARRLFGSELVSQTPFAGVTRGHVRSGRRLSTERLAALMMRRLCPDLSIEYGLSARLESRWPEPPEAEIFKGKAAWRFVEKLLVFLWRGDVHAVPHDDGVRIVGERWDKQCIIRGQRNVEFFRLTKQDAAATTELYHQLKGWYAFLMAARREPHCDRISAWATRVHDVLSDIRIVVDDERGIQEDRSAAPRREPTIVLTEKEDVVAVLGRASELLRDFRNQITAEVLPADWYRYEDAFRSHRVGMTGLKEWLEAAQWLYLRQLPYLPAKTTRSGERTPVDVFDLLRIMCDRWNGLRAPEYRIEHTLYNSKPFKGRPPSNDDGYLRLKKLIAAELEGVFRECQAERRAVGNDRWQQNLAPNPWMASPADKLRSAVDRFGELHEHCTSSPAAARYFSDVANERKASFLADLRKPVASDSSEGAWRSLFYAGLMITQLTTEVLEPSAFPGGPEEDLVEAFKAKLADSRLQRLADVTFSLRNRAAHTLTAKQRGTWNEVQAEIGRWLGRRWSPSKETSGGMFGPSHLELTPLEATEVKCKLIEGWLRVFNRLLEIPNA